MSGGNARPKVQIVTGRGRKNQARSRRCYPACGQPKPRSKLAGVKKGEAAAVIGTEMGRGKSMEEIMGESRMVAEGIRTTQAIHMPPSGTGAWTGETSPCYLGGADVKLDSRI